MNAEERAVLLGLLESSFEEMFAEAKRPATPSGEREMLLGVSIGFSGPGLRGALVMAARPCFFAATYPLPGPEPAAADVDDWARESANQMLGRVKNRLAARGLQMNVTTPIALRGIELHIAGRDRAGVVRYSTNRHATDVTVLFELERLDGQELLAPNAPESAASAEGESLLF
jgi:hypothetical protein